MGSIDIYKPQSTFLQTALLIDLSNIDNFSSEKIRKAENQTQGNWVRKQIC